jgi:hypothetical protein
MKPTNRGNFGGRLEGSGPSDSDRAVRIAQHLLFRDPFLSGRVGLRYFSPTKLRKTLLAMPQPCAFPVATTVSWLLPLSIILTSL